DILDPVGGEFGPRYLLHALLALEFDKARVIGGERPRSRLARILLAMKDRRLRQARLDIGGLVGIGIADAHAKQRHDMRRQSKFGSDLFRMVSHRPDIDKAE